MVSPPPETYLFKDFTGICGVFALFWALGKAVLKKMSKNVLEVKQYRRCIFPRAQFQLRPSFKLQYLKYFESPSFHIQDANNLESKPGFKPKQLKSCQSPRFKVKILRVSFSIHLES